MSILNKKPRGRKAKKQKETQNENTQNEISVDLFTINESFKNDDVEPLIQDTLNETFEQNPEILSDLTLAELAELALPYSNRSIETLKRLKREELIYIVTNQKDNYKTNEFNTIGNDTKDILELLIEILNEIKIKREGKPINAILLKVLRRQDKKISEGLVKAGASGGVVGYSLCFFTLICVFIDSFFGFDNIILLFKKDANKKENVKNEAKSNIYDHR